MFTMKDRQIYCSFHKNKNTKMIYIGILDTHGQLDKPHYYYTTLCNNVYRYANI